MFDRKKCKAEANALFSANRKISILSTLIFYAITIVLAIPMIVFEVLFLLGAESGNIALPVIGFFLSTILFVIIISMFSMGITIYYYNIKKGTAKSLKDLWKCIKGRNILAFLYLVVRLLPWALLMYVPYAVMIAVITFTESFSIVSALVTIVCLGIFIWLAVVYIQKAIAYSCFEYEYADNPELSIRESFKKAYEYTKGNKMALFVMSLSFLGWELLCCLTCGILYLYVEPYMYFAFINAWDEIRANKDGNKIEAEKAPEALPENTEE